METAYDIKIILLGETDVGKSSLLLRFAENKFKDSLPRTIINHSKTDIKIAEKRVQLTVWDTAGREAYYKLVKSYYDVVDGALLIYDIHDARTLHSVTKWLHDFKSVNKNAEILIAGNKADDGSKKSSHMSELKKLLHNEKLDCLQVSAKSNTNVDILFHHLVRRILAAKRILPYSKDKHLTELEKYEDYISWSSISLELQDIVDTSITSKSHGTSESQFSSLESTEYEHLNTMHGKTKSSIIADELLDEDMSSGEYGFVFYSIEDLTGQESISIDSADSAMEFFEAGR